MAVQLVRWHLLLHRMITRVKYGDFRGYGRSADGRKRIDGGFDSVCGTLGWKFQILASFADASASSRWISEGPQQPRTWGAEREAVQKLPCIICACVPRCDDRNLTSPRLQKRDQTSPRPPLSLTATSSRCMAQCYRGIREFSMLAR